MGSGSTTIACLFLLTAAAGCQQALGPIPAIDSASVLRVGMGPVTSGTAEAGLRRLRLFLTTEALLTVTGDGRLSPWLADSWTTTPDGLTLTIRLRSGVRFHDGSPVNATTIVKVLLASLPESMGLTYEDIADIRSVEDRTVTIHLRRPSPFVLEALQYETIRKSTDEPTGTGPFIDSGAAGVNEVRANQDYYLGAPRIQRVTLDSYPSIRAAWADLLRGRLDMLYEVGPEAFESLRNTRRVAVFQHTRDYQSALVFNPRAQVFREPSVRRALNMAIDRESVITDAFEGRAEVSSGLIPPHHWAFQSEVPGFSYDPHAAARLLKSVPGGRSFAFECLVPPDTERLALVVKRQLQAVGVEMNVREVSPNEFAQAVASRRFEAVMTEFLSGPTLFKVYGVWHSRGSLVGGLGGPLLDAALDRVRHASSDDEYRTGVADVQRAVVQDPPAIFLAWSRRARAVSRRFEVPTEPNADVLATLRLWRPASAQLLGEGWGN